MSIVKICGAGTEDDQIMKDVQYCTKEFALDPKGHVYVLAKSLQLCPTLCDPIDYSPPGFSVHGILQERILEWVAMPSSRESSRPRNHTHTSYISCIGRRVRIDHFHKEK